MAEIKLTREQQAVVDNRGGALLVSAAAGSGKTKVLVDRLLAQVLDPDHEVNIDEFLMITYTKAAASELRGKIAAELAKRLAADPDNLRLQRQSTRIYLAQISTVHAFCATILREYAHVLDIPAEFRVCEEQEADALRQEVFDDLLEEVYQTLDEHPQRRALIDQLGYGRDDRRLPDLVLPVYDAIRCRVDPKGWMAQCMDAYSFADNTPAEQTIWGQALIASLSRVLESAERNLNDALRLMDGDESLQISYAPLFTENRRAVAALRECTAWDEIYERRTLDFGRLRPVRKPQDAERQERAKALREAAKETVKDALKPFYAPSARVMGDLKYSASAIGGLLELVQLFETHYTQEKRRRKLFDFSDLEHETIRLLVQKQSGKPTAVAREISQRYREILVDEYQDSNAVQECIFEAVSRDGSNRFMVGDVKQSIYRFRLADPGIFLQKYARYPLYTKAADGEGRKILLSENFRSRHEILQAVNDVFSLIMRPEAAELSYTDAEALKNGKKDYPETPQPKVELHCIELETDTERKTVKTQGEAAFVAARIAQLLRDQTPVTDGAATRPVRPGDIVILMRSPGSAAADYVSALARYQIPCATDRGGSILDTTEVEVFSAILQIIDNPHRDIPLVTAMASQAFAFSPDTLAAARAQKRDGDLYDCLRAYAPQNEALTRFFAWLDRMRQCAAELTLRELMDEILLTTKLDDIYAAMPGGQTRKRNLLALYTLALDNEASYGGSLSGFCRWIAQLRESGGATAQVASDAAGDAVRIMSIHKSKGLEFPVVFLADLSRKFNLSDSTSPVLLDDALLIGSNIVDTASKSYYPGAARMAIAARKKQQLIAEEMRVLYVAMTRAREMLIMSYCGTRLTSTLQKWNASLTHPLRPEVAASALCPGDWVLMTALCRTEAGELFALCGQNNVSEVQNVPWKICYRSADTSDASPVTVSGSFSSLPAAQKDAEALTAPLAYRYPHMAATAVSSKLTATQLKGRVLDREAAEEAQPIYREPAEQFRRPDFAPKAQLTGREKGSATHLFMQYVRYACCTTRESVEAERARLVTERYLTQQQADSVNLEQILTLFTGSFGKRILAAKNPVREFKFSILTDAGVYVPEAAGEQVMLQGVVDCFWQEADGLVIVDFKTDFIRDNLKQKALGYTPQLEAYAKALGRIYSCPVKAKYLYFFSAGQEVLL